MCTRVEIQGADEREWRMTNADEAESSRRLVDRSIDLVQGNVVHEATNTSVLSLTDPPFSPKTISTKRQASSGRQCAIATSESLCQPEAEGC